MSKSPLARAWEITMACLGICVFVTVLVLSVRELMMNGGAP